MPLSRLFSAACRSSPPGGAAYPNLSSTRKTACWWSPAPPQRVKSAIERLLDDPDLYRRLCDGARRRGDLFSKQCLVRSHGHGPSRLVREVKLSQGRPLPQICALWQTIYRLDVR